MKMVSTAAVKATKNFSQPKLTIGLDLGDRSSWYCLLDEVGEVLVEQKPGTTPKAMGRCSEPCLAATLNVLPATCCAMPGELTRKARRLD
jgi:hypothetical protein